MGAKKYELIRRYGDVTNELEAYIEKIDQDASYILTYIFEYIDKHHDYAFEEYLDGDGPFFFLEGVIIPRLKHINLNVLLNEMIVVHEMQPGEILYSVYGWYMIHNPSCLDVEGDFYG